MQLMLHTLRSDSHMTTIKDSQCHQEKINQSSKTMKAKTDQD